MRVADVWPRLSAVRPSIHHGGHQCTHNNWPPRACANSHTPCSSSGDCCAWWDDAFGNCVCDKIVHLNYSWRYHIFILVQTDVLHRSVLHQQDTDKGLVMWLQTIEHDTPLFVLYIQICFVHTGLKIQEKSSFYVLLIQPHIMTTWQNPSSIDIHPLKSPICRPNTPKTF